MTIYIDLIFLINYILDFTMLYVIQKMFSDEISIKRLMIGCLISSLFIFSIFINNYLYLFIKVFGGVVIIMISVKSISLSKQIIKICLFYTLNFAFVGFLYTFNVTNHLFLFCSMGLILSLLILENNRKYFVFINRCKYKVFIKFSLEGKILNGFLDNGNECICNNKPVIFIDKKYQNVLLSIKDIPECSLFVTTVNGVKKQLVYKPHVFTISIKNKVYYKDVLIAFADISKECLINPYLLL